MALATQCPHCHTTFRVAHDQLKLRAGLVRCGACKQIFNGIENLLRAEQQAARPAAAAQPVAAASSAASPPPASSAATPSAASPSAATQPTSSAPIAPSPAIAAPPAAALESPSAAPAATAEMDKDKGQAPDQFAERDARGDDEHLENRTAQAGSDSPDGALGSPEAPSPGAPVGEVGKHDDAAMPAEASALPPAQPHQDDDPLLRMTLMDISEQSRSDEDPDQDRPDPIDVAIADLQRKPLRGGRRVSDEEDEDDEGGGYEEPSFVRQGRRRQRLGRTLRWTMGIGSMLLLLTLLGQSAFVFRDQLAARFPATKPALQEVCAWLDCQVGLPMRIDAVAIESSELQTLTPNGTTLGLNVLLRNHAGTAQAWPHLELTLNDSGERPLARRVFAPPEYLPAGINLRLGFPAHSEQPVRLYLEPQDLKPSGYRVYLFYP